METNLGWREGTQHARSPGKGAGQSRPRLHAGGRDGPGFGIMRQGQAGRWALWTRQTGRWRGRGAENDKRDEGHMAKAASYKVAAAETCLMERVPAAPGRREESFQMDTVRD
jgi:hypothetical protein